MTQTLKMNELFQPAGLASQVLYHLICLSSESTILSKRKWFAQKWLEANVLKIQKIEPQRITEITTEMATLIHIMKRNKQLAKINPPKAGAA